MTTAVFSKVKIKIIAKNGNDGMFILNEFAYKIHFCIVNILEIR